jgi:DNA mismatch endonuclease, patch repair protein
MSRIRSKNTAPELNVRRAAHGLGLRFRLHCSDLPGKPDLVFRRWKTALFVHGYFWHSHRCERSRLPKANVEYWMTKLERNTLRDRDNVRRPKKSGWRCAVIWECQAKDPDKLNRILRRLFDAGRRR